MDGGICFNEWLIREGYLVLESSPGSAHAHRQGEDRLGADEGLGRRRVLRAPLHERPGPGAPGTIDPADYESVRNELVAKIEAIEDPAGPQHRLEGLSAGGHLPGGARRRARPHRLLRQPRLALGRRGGGRDI